MIETFKPISYPIRRLKSVACLEGACDKTQLQLRLPNQHPSNDRPKIVIRRVVVSGRANWNTAWARSGPRHDPGGRQYEAHSVSHYDQIFGKSLG